MDNRRHLRAKISAPCRWAHGQARGSDLSVGGLRLEGVQLIPGERLALTLESMGTLLKVSVIVAWSHRGRSGVRFASLSLSQLQLISRWVHELPA